MTGSPSNQEIFDVRKIRRLVELMQEHDLTEIDLREGAMRVRLRRGGEPARVTYEGPPALAPPPAQTTPPREVQQAPLAKTETASEGANVALIRSPMVGTFYAASDPDSPPHVKIGDHVGPETTVCIIEAMKVFNQIPAEVSGKITAMLVENGAPVEFGQPLFKVDTRD